MSTSVEYPTCVRHLRPRKDVKVHNYYMCDGCARRWTKEAFDGNSPLYVGESVQGYCLLCNAYRKTIKVRSWFLCDICDRVARSIGRNHVAEESILDYWDQNVKPRFPFLELVRNDESSLRPRRDTDQSGVAAVDFLAVDSRTEKNVFGVENKTGRSSIRDMSQFQVDTSDCDCITNEMASLNIPVYVVHAQVLELWEPPTTGFRIVGLWWSDPYKMKDHFRSIRTRRDEMRGAAYFSKKAFSDMDTFVESLWGEEDFVLVEQFRNEGIPRMYFTDE